MHIRHRALLSLLSGWLKFTNVLGCSFMGLVLGEVGMFSKMGWVISSSGKFLRRFRLPEKAKTDEVKASMENRGADCNGSESRR